MSIRNGIMLSLSLMAALAALLVPAALSEAADDREPDDTYYRYTIKFSSTSTDWLYLRWDFGDGTVLDGRWEAYREAAESGGELPEGVAEGFSAYSALLEAEGGSITNPVHTYSEKGLYDWSIESFNPRGYVIDGMAYDGIFVTDFTGYDGGLLSGSEEESVRGSYSKATYLMAVMGYPVITFDTDGGPAVEPVTVENTDVYASAVKPEDPVWEGHDFEGWYTDQARTNLYSWSSRVTAPMTLYAKWSDMPTYDHVVTYVYGSTAIKTQTVTTWSEMPATAALEPPAELSRLYYTLGGWEMDGTVYHAGDVVDIPVTGLTMKAYWIENTLTFEPLGIVQAYQGHTGSFRVQAAADIGSPSISYSLRNVPSSIDASVSGQEVTFTGSEVGTWVVTVVASAANYFDASTTVTMAIQPEPLYDHTIVYMDDDEVVHTQTDRNTVAGLWPTHVDQPELESRPCYAFVGWEDSDGAVYVQGSEINVPAGEKVLTAKWQEKVLSISDVGEVSALVGKTSVVNPEVTSNPAGARIGLSVSSIPAGLTVVVDGGSVRVTPTAPGDYTFVLSVFAEDYHGSSQDIAVKAVSPAYRSIVYMDGGKEIAVQDVTGPPGAVSVAIVSGIESKKLAGWSTSEGGAVELHEGDEVSVPAGGLVLYAVWEKPFDWLPWVVMAIGVVCCVLGLYIGRWDLVIVGAVAVVLGLVDVLGVFNTFWWWE